jgi:uncharacterized membrane protein
MLFRFVVYGCMGLIGETVYTAIVKLIYERDWRLPGTTYLWMFPIYGLIAPLYEPVHDLIRYYPLPIRAVIWSVGFTAIEFITGWSIGQLINGCPWDYRDKRFAINQYIRWDFFPLWAAVGLAIEPSHDLLVRITPLFLKAI